MSEQDKKIEQKESVFCCCPTIYCCGYACCCCVSSGTEGKPLLGSGSPGQYSLPKGQEVQSMDMHFPSNQSVAESSPWSSERHSEASDIPNIDDLELPETHLVTEQPRPQDRRLSWKINSESKEQTSFTIQIRQQTDDQ